MIKNYLLVAVRNILKNKLFSFINMTGLILGTVACMLIFMYVQDELSYDKFHEDHQNLYRVGLQARMGQDITVPNSCTPLGAAMKNEIPGVEAFVRLVPPSSRRLAFRYEDKSIMEENVFYTDSNFFSFFSFSLLKGNPATVLKEPNMVVLTESTARKYFGDEDPIGKTLILANDRYPCKVTGIAADPPSNSHVHFNALVSFYTIEKTYNPSWLGNSLFTYVRKTPATKADEINARLEDMVAKYVSHDLEAGLGFSFEQFRKQGGVYRYFVFPIADSHLSSSFPEDIEPAGSWQYIYIFIGVGIFILLIACVNFMNLSTARSAGRAKEVGLRKTLGSLRRQMIFQFIAESFVYSLLAVVVSFGICLLLLPYFNVLAGKHLTIAALTQPNFLLMAGAMIVVVGFVAGSYPAFYLTSFSAVEVLKGKVRAGMRSKGVRSSLVVVQFALSTFMIIATAVVFSQLDYLQSRNLGLDKQNVITINGLGRLDQNRQAFRNEVANIAGVQAVSFTNNSFPGMNNTTAAREKGKEVDHLVGLYSADWDHLAVMKMELKEGRYFSKEFITDSSAIIINEAAVRDFGLKDPVVGQELSDYETGKLANYRIIGVLKDFNFESLHEKVRPVIIHLVANDRILMVRYSGDARATLAAIEKTWQQLAPGEPFEYSFLDERYDEMFRAEMRMRNIISIFSTLAIVIACLGLFALATFTAEQRTKEIGVRKALGASAFSLSLLLSKEFTRLVLIAVVPAVAAGYAAANWWLQDFPYRVELNPMIFVGSAFVAFLIAAITVSFQSVKAAFTNPVKSLRYE